MPARPGVAPAVPALLAGGLGVCAHCGRNLAIHSIRKPHKSYSYYYCKHHVFVPTACPGLSFPVPYLDPGAWFEFTGVLGDLGEGNDSYLDKLSRQQFEIDASQPQPAEPGADLKAARAYFVQQVALATDDLAHLTSTTGRESLREQINRFGAEIEEADRKLAALERQAATVTERRAVLNNYLEQWHRYSYLVNHLDPYEARDIPIMAEIMRLVGAQLRRGKTAHGLSEIAAELIITP